jgi:hypothetical protein
VRGRNTPSRVTSCSTSQLGLPTSLPASTAPPDASFMLPGSVLDAVHRVASGIGNSPLPPESALWLEFPVPRGYLYLVPWERLLAPIGRPLIRLPNHTVRPQASAQSLEIALCASAPAAREAFDAPELLVLLARQWITQAGHQVRVHLFTDAESFPELIRRAAELGAAAMAHDPAEAARYSTRGRSVGVGSSSGVGNPWLLWIRDSMNGRALDAVHFLNEGFLSGSRGALALARTPLRNTDERLSRPVGSAEVSTFLSQTGAWGLMLSGPHDNESGAGLRELADCIAQVHPGVVLAHELSADPAAADFGALLAMVFGDGTPVTHPTPGISCWVHPKFVEYPGESEGGFGISGDEPLLREATAHVLNEDQTPAWVAAGARYLEAQQADWLPKNPEEAADPDALAALDSVSALLDKHVAQHLRHQAGGG